MKKYGPLSLLVLGMAALYTPSEAIYKFQFVHGNNCTSITPGATPTYTEYGLSNPTNTDITVSCPVVPDSVANLKNIRYTVYAWNRNNARKLSCTLSTTAMMGGVTSSTTVIFPYVRNENRGDHTPTQLFAHSLYDLLHSGHGKRVGLLSEYDQSPLRILSPGTDSRCARGGYPSSLNS